MIIEDRLIEKIISQNLGMLFSDDMFKIKIEHDEKGDRTMVTVHQSDIHDIILSAIFEMRTAKRHHTMRIISTQFYCEDIDETFEDFVKCCKEIKAKVEEIGSMKTIYHENDDGLVVNFREIGIEEISSGFTKRDLFIKRSNDISLIKFNDDGSINTISLDEQQFRDMLNSFLGDPDVHVDFSSVDIIMFADYDKYVDDEDE